MPTFAGIGLVLLLEVAAVAATALWRLRAGRRRDRFADLRHLTAVLEIEHADAPLPAETAVLPADILRGLRDDPLLGLADVHVVRQVQRLGADVPEHSPLAASYQSLNNAVPAMLWTWLSLRLELTGSRNRAWAYRASGPIEARGGGRLGAVRTLDKAADTAIAKLSAAGFTVTRLDEDEAGGSLESSTSFAAATPPATMLPKLLHQREPVEEQTITVPAGGILLGRDPSHHPVVLTLFRRRPLTATVVGGLHLAQVLVLRAAAVGARVVVETARPGAWDPVALHSGLDSTRLAMQHVGRVAGNPGWPPPSPAMPMLVIRDCGARPPYASVPYGPWVSVVTLLPFLDPRTAGQLGHADLVGFQRLTEDEAAVARHVLALSDQDTAALADLSVDTVLWRAKGRAPRTCEVTGTDWELRVLGPAHR